MNVCIEVAFWFKAAAAAVCVVQSADTSLCGLQSQAIGGRQVYPLLMVK
jgi:hypothetical protein